ncbi:Vegetative incompatibility protein HET-E-1 [Colletotrichum siamense]|uniref:Vegetative incompatibility protein HET-E-1 n=1 Tax=Colletotrichum siamense TaxID=690259 RepID=A0A9P5K756_COLSI|nr:Vegetative incompatibility protein HET-E-1 [Colletotrichum siamense]KAF4862991.1 Vegetative incompatibility protein HET-E-1 [Colletotrichum siamense]
MAEKAASLIFQPQPSDVLIAVMGITGSGKSTFISHCTDKNVSIGEGLHSDTQDIVPYPCKPDIGANVYLIDTPGFDDTERDDAEILRQIATWVGDTYKKKVHIRGILYLHRITDVRMQGAAIRNLFMFKKLCGKDALQNVILVTTMWGEVRHNVGIQREDELRTKPGYWGEMISRGSRMARHHNHDESARNIIHTLLDTTTRTTLAIQTEMVDENKDLHDTSAGKELDSILTLERERFARDIEQLKQDMAEARELQDKESQDQIQQLQKQRQDEIANLLHQQESLKVSLEQLHEERFAKLEQLLTTQQSQMEKDRLKIAELREQLAKASLVKSPDLTHSSSNLDAATHRCVHNLEGHTSEVNSVFFSPDSECLASGSGDHTIKIFDSKLGRCLQTLEGHSRSVSSIAYSPDGRHIASASRLQKGTINIWDSRSGRSLQRLEDEDGAVFSLAYSPDGRRIVSATGSSDNTAK